MRNLLTLFALAFLFSNSLTAQLGDGDIAPDFTLTDINGNSHNLYDYLDQGYSVVLDFSATWCPPCWSYHNNGTLDEIWHSYGPDGTDQVLVFMVEADPSTTPPCIYGPAGCSGGSLGDWTAGVDYYILNPEAPEASDINNDYNINYWPTLYGIAPNKAIYEVGQESVQGWENWLLESFQMVFSETYVEDDDCYTSFIDLDVVGGYGTVDVEWSNGEETEDISGIENGDYYVTISDSNGFEFEMGPIEVDNGNIGEIILLELQDVACNNDFSGIIEVEFDGGSGNFDYDWSNGDSGPLLEDINGGDYELTVTDQASGCEFETEYYVDEPDVMEVYLEVENAECGLHNNGAVEFTVDGGVYPFTFIFDDFESTNDYLVLEPGQYDVTISDGNECEDYASFEILQDEAPFAVATATDNFTCVVDTVYVHADSSSVGNNIIYNWFDATNEFIGSGYQIQVDTAGIYTLEVYDEKIECSSFSSVAVSMNMTNPAAVATSSNDIDCNNSTAVISGLGSSTDSLVTYMWTTTDGNINSDPTLLDIDVSSAGTYQLSVSHSISGCVGLAEATVVAIDIPIIDLEGDLDFCEGFSTTLCVEASSDEAITWMVDGNNEGGANCITLDNSSSVEVSLTNVITGCSSMEVYDVNQNQEADIDILPPSELGCSEESTFIDLSIDTEGTISWYDEDNNLLSNDEDIEVTEAGTYYVVVETDQGCLSQAEVAVIENLDDLLDPQFMYNSSEFDFTFEDQTQGTVDSRVWDFGDGNTSTEANPSHSYTTPGYYQVCLTSTNDCGDNTNCQEVLAKMVMQISTIVSDASCFGTNDGRLEVNVFGGLPGFTFEWDMNGNTLTGNPIENLAPGTYNLEVTDASGEVLQDTYTVSEPDELHVEANVVNTSNGEANGSITLNISGGNSSSYSIVWSNGSTDATIDQLAAGDYSVLVTDAKGCITESIYTVEASTTNVNEIEFINTFKVYPNPADDKVYIDLELDKTVQMEIRVLSILGKVYQSSRVNDSIIRTSIDVSAIPNGVYFIELKAEGKVSLKKLVVSH